MVSPCGFALDAGEQDDDGQLRPSAAAWPGPNADGGGSSRPGRDAKPYPGTRSSRSTPQGRVGGLGGDSSIRSVGSIIGWARPGQRVVTEVDDDIRPGLQVGAQGELGAQGILDAISPSASAATSIASSARVPPQNRPQRPGTGASASTPRQAGHLGTECPSAVSARLGRGGGVRPGPGMAQCTRRAQGRGVRLDGGEDLRSRGFETTTIDVVASSAARASSAWSVERPPTAAEVAAAHPEAVAHADPGGVEQASPAVPRSPRRRPDPPTRGGPRSRETEGDPTDDGRAAVRPHDEQVALARRSLQGDLVRHRDVVAEEHDRDPASSASASAVALEPGTG